MNCLQAAMRLSCSTWRLRCGRCTALSCHPNLIGNRWYGLPKSVTGELLWEKKYKERQGLVKVQHSVDELLDRPMANLKRCRYAKVTQLNEVYDTCRTRKDLKKAERLLVAYRHSLSFPRRSLPMVVVRACIRVGKPDRALHYARNKVQFGVFPTRRVYNVIMDACLKRKDARGAMSAYELLLSDEWDPDGMTYYMAAKAALHLELEKVKGAAVGNPKEALNDKETIKKEDSVDVVEEETKLEAEDKESTAESESSDPMKDDLETTEVIEIIDGLDLTKTLELCEQCFQLEPKLGTKSYRIVFAILLNRGYVKEAGEILDSLQTKDKLPKQTIMNLKLDLFTNTSNFENAFSLLKSLSSPENSDVGAPKKGLPRLHRAVVKTKNEELRKYLDDLCTELEGGH